MTEPATPSLIVERTTKVIVRDQVDLVAWLGGLPEHERTAYASTDLMAYGCEAEWERPLAYLFAHDVEVDGGYYGVKVRPTNVDTDDDDAWVRSVNGEAARGRWTVEHYAALRDAVPWIAALDAEQRMSDDDVKRLPGPNDSPLF